MVTKADSASPTPPPYLTAVLAACADAPPGRVAEVWVLHDDWCPLLAGAGPCCCSPTVTKGFVLWRRDRKGKPWSMVATLPTERHAWALVKDRGDYCVLPAGTEP